MVKRLTKAGAILFLVMIALVGTIVGLTAHVIESSKETETGDSGVTYVKGSNTPSATAGLLKQLDLSEAYAYSDDELDNMKSLRLASLDGNTVYSYTITGWTRNQSSVAFYASRGDVITVGSEGEIVAKDAAENELLNLPGGSRRRLTQFGGGGFGGALLTTGSFTMMAASGGFLLLRSTVVGFVLVIGPLGTKWAKVKHRLYMRQNILIGLLSIFQSLLLVLYIRIVLPTHSQPLICLSQEGLCT